MKNKTPTLRKIKDLNQASWLKLKKLKLYLEPEWEGNSAYFIFEDDGRADELIESYINGNAVGNIRDFAEIQRGLKQMLFK
jgi:hypothetical protein